MNLCNIIFIHFKFMNFWGEKIYNYKLYLKFIMLLNKGYFIDMFYK
jgi:hypothetical protein